MSNNKPKKVWTDWIFDDCEVILTRKDPIPDGYGVQIFRKKEDAPDSELLLLSWVSVEELQENLKPLIEAKDLNEIVDYLCTPKRQQYNVF